MKLRFINRWTARSIIKALENGRFRRILSQQQFQEWMNFVQRQASIPHNKEVILRVTLNDHGRSWYLWAVYGVINVDPIFITLKAFFAPSNEESRCVTPEPLVGRDFFPA